jgi:hypothetical protein
MSDGTEPGTPKPRKKYNYIGAPACFALDLAIRHINEAFEGECYVVGSALERPDWRDVDVRMIMDDEDFAKNFPDVVANRWENDAKWLLLTTAISDWLSKQTGLPVDFQFQSQTQANARHKGRREATGFRMFKEK